MTTTQLRRYELEPRSLGEFCNWWRSTLAPVRIAHGFTIPFAFVSQETAEFVWAVSVQGSREDFARVESDYLQSEDRATAFASLPVKVLAQHLSFVESVAL